MNICKSWRQIVGVGVFLGAVAGVGRAEWQVETVDGTTSAGYAASLALDAGADVPSVSYYRDMAGFPGFFDLIYAMEPSGGNWQREDIRTGMSAFGVGAATSIALTELGTPMVSFSQGMATVRLASRIGGSWSDETVAMLDGRFSSLVWRGTEAAPEPAIAFNDAAGADLEFGRFSGTWLLSTLDSMNAGVSCSLAQRGDYMGIAYIRGSNLGYFESNSGGGTWAANPNNAFAPFNAITAASCALAIAPATKMDPVNSRAHILYFSAATNTYSYVTNDTDTGVWAAPEVVFVSAANDTGYYGGSIAVGSDGVVRVAFLDFATRQLKYAERTAAGWPTPETVDSTPSGAFCSLKLTANNEPRIAYAALGAGMNPPTTGLRYAAFRVPVPPVPPTPPTPPVASDLKVLGKKTRTTGAKMVRIKGTASSNIARVEWRVGKKKFKSVAVSGGRWTVKVRPLAEGKNKAQFRGVDSAGQTTPVQKVRIKRS